MINLRAVDFRNDPYPYYKMLRMNAPICRVEPHGNWLITRHQDVITILKNHELFSSEINEEREVEGPPLLLASRGMLGKDRPEHTRLRKRLQRVFTLEMIKRLESKIRLVVKNLLDSMFCNDHFDLVKDFSSPLPITVICHLLGIDQARAVDMKRWSDVILTWRGQSYSPSEINSSIESMYDCLTTTIAEKRKAKQDDIISLLVHDESDEKLTVLEIVIFLRMLIVAGTDTTTHLLSNTVLLLLDRQEIVERIQRDQNLVEPLIEESLRFDSPVQCIMRKVVDDVILSGVQLKKDEVILVGIASANRDENVFRESDVFDIDREHKHHLTFGSGIHFCMGAHLARLQARIALTEMYARARRFVRHDDKPRSYFNSIFFRGVITLPLVALR